MLVEIGRPDDRFLVLNVRRIDELLAATLAALSVACSESHGLVEEVQLAYLFGFVNSRYDR